MAAIDQHEAAIPAGHARGLRDAVLRDRSYLLGLLETLVRTESHASQPAGVNAVGETVALSMQHSGFTYERLRPPPPRSDSAWLAEIMLPGGDFAGIGDVWRLERPGEGAPVLLLGDLDTAFPAGSGSKFPFRVDGDLAYGPGIADMKGGLVVLAAAARALAACGCRVPPIVVVLSPDEQAGSLASRSVIGREANRSRACLCLECARDGGNLMASRAHVGVAKIEVFGQDAHAGTEHARGRSAVRAFARSVESIEDLTDRRAGRLVTVTQVRGGWRRSVIPGHCVALVDIRTRSARSWEHVERGLRQIAAEQIGPGGFRTDIRIAQHRPGFARTQRSEPLIQLIQMAADALGLKFGFIGSDAAGSSAFAASLPVVDGMGPPGGSLMTSDEHISIPGLIERSALLALVVAMFAATDVGLAEDG